MIADGAAFGSLASSPVPKPLESYVYYRREYTVGDLFSFAF